MRFNTRAAPVLLLTSFTSALYADEAYKIDYAHTLLGLPRPSTTFFHKPRDDSRASLLYTLSDQGVLGAVNPGTGDIVWRQFLQDQYQGWRGENVNVVDARLNGSARANGKDIVTIVGGRVTSWDALTGRESWGNEFQGIGRDVEVFEGVGSSVDGDVLTLVEDAGIAVTRRLDSQTGDVVWQYAGDMGDIPIEVSTNIQHVFVVSLHGSRGAYNIKIDILDTLSGKRYDHYVLATKADISSVQDILFVGANTAQPIIAWAERGFASLKVNILGTKAIKTLALDTSTENISKIAIHAPRSIQSRPHFLVHCQTKSAHWADVFHIDLNGDAITQAYHLPKLSGSGSFSTSEADANVYFTRNTQEEVVIVGSGSHAVLGRFNLPTDSAKGALLHSVSEVVKSKGDAYAARSAVVTANDDWIMAKNGVPAWKREEGLSGAVAAAFADIPFEETLAETLEAEAHSHVLSAYVQRVNRHVHELQHLPAFLLSLPHRVLAAVSPSDTVKPTDVLTRDGFGFRKLVIIATERGRVYALDHGDAGWLVWSIKAFDLPPNEKWNVKIISVDGEKGTVMIRAAGGEYIVLRTATGETVESEWRGSWPATQAAVTVNSEAGPWVLTVGQGGDPGPLPLKWAPKDVVVVRSEGEEVRGLKFFPKQENAIPHEAWAFRPGQDEKIISITARPLQDPIASIGRVLADRTVLYKYINPNTILVTTGSKATSSMSLYLVDTTSGAVLWTTTHPYIDLSMPTTATLTENWIAYTLYSEANGTAAKGSQLIIAEFYESELSNDRGPLGTAGNFSSHRPSAIPTDDAHLPHVKTSAFIIPAPVSHMTTTSTLQGITTKSLLMTLPLSHAILALPRHILDPRRPAGRPPTKLETEEGLLPYVPALDFDARLSITHQREVVGVRGVITSPALLESTSLVLAYGVDVFGTRVMPSGAFDVLGGDFNKVTLVGTVLGLAVLTGWMRPMVGRKQINARWRS